MYVNKTNGERDLDFELPLAQKQVIFSESDFLEEGYFGFDTSTMTQEAKDNLELIYVSRIDEAILQITECYPIVKYFSKNTENLNRFVESITVAVVSGTRVRFDNEFEGINEIFGDEAIIYITNPSNISTEIYYHDLIRLLYKKPDLTVTNEGVLLFYTSTDLFATLDCTSGNPVGVEELAEAVGNSKIKSINSIYVENGITKINFKSVNGNELSKEYKLTFNFDFFSECGVTIKISEIGK